MCAANNSQPQKSTNSNSKATVTPSQKPEPKWLKMKRLNKSSADKTAKPTGKPSNSAQKANQQTRKQKRDRWIKNAKPAAKKPAAPRKRGPVYDYISDCCGIPTRKIPCGTKTPTIDPETGKSKDKVTGLGHFRCNGLNGCKKPCSVTRKAHVTENPYLTPEQKAQIEALPKGNIGGLEVAPYPGPLTTPVIVEAPVATTAA